MERTLILLFATLMVFVTSGVQAQLSFATNNTTVNINRTRCGSTKLCVQTPDACDPAGSSNCLFGSVRLKNGTISDFVFQLSGFSSGNSSANSYGYIALGLDLSTTTGSTLLFICAQNPVANTTINFFTKLYNNSFGTVGNQTNVTVTQIRGVVNNSKIQCEFTVPNLNATSNASLLRSQDTTFGIVLGSGTLDQNGNSLTFKVQISTNLLDLSNPAANVANTTAAPTTTTSGTNRALHSEGVLLLTGLLSLVFLKTA